MMLFPIFIIALLASLLFAPGYRKGTFTPFFIFFFILFFAGLAGQYWIVPFGPNWLGVSWGPLLFIVLICTFLFAAPSPYERSNNANDINIIPSLAISIFLWLLFILLVMAILLGYYKTTYADILLPQEPL